MVDGFQSPTAVECAPDAAREDAAGEDAAGEEVLVAH
jgi:hypothetical protein